MNITTIDFHGDTLFATERGGRIYVAIKPICDSMGIEWRKQRERINRDPILSKGSTMTVLPSAGGPQETTLLRLDLMNGWLFGIDESRVKDEETRQRILWYKEECYEALFQHFYSKAASNKRRRDGDAPSQAEKASLAERRVRVLEMNAASRTIDRIHRSGGARAVVANATEVYAKVGLRIDMSMADISRQGELPLGGDDAP